MEKKVPILDSNELLMYIEYLRLEMYNTALKFGFNHVKTIKTSTELDYFIYEYQKAFK